MEENDVCASCFHFSDVRGKENELYTSADFMDLGIG